jgi:hypothetical protein
MRGAAYEPRRAELVARVLVPSLFGVAFVRVERSTEQTWATLVMIVTFLAPYKGLHLRYARRWHTNRLLGGY